MSHVEDQRPREALREAPVPDEAAAEGRAWEVVRTAFAERDTAAARGKRPWGGLALAAAGVAAAVALTPAGASVREWIEDAIVGERNARTSLRSLPTSGSILTTTPDSAWIVRDDGSRRRLGEYERVTWSPNGLYLGAVRDRELFALELDGGIRWRLTAPQPILALDWSTGEGYRIAYVAVDPSGRRQLRLVAGDGTADSGLVPRVGSLALAWQPESSSAPVHRLAYIDQDRRVTLMDTDSGRTLWRSAPIAAPVERLEWSRDGRRLLVVTPEFALAFAADGSPLLKGPVTTRAGEVTLAPDGRSIAVARAAPKGGAQLALLPLTRRADGQPLYRSSPATGEARFGTPSFSPDGEWILLPWPQADQWLFVRIADRRVVAVADISRLLETDRRRMDFPEVAGWCC